MTKYTGLSKKEVIAIIYSTVEDRHMLPLTKYI